jgi:hypothetical protein
MTKADDQRIAALARKNAAKASQPKKPKRTKFDDTVREDTEEDLDARKFFSQMKKREFDKGGH